MTVSALCRRCRKTLQVDEPEPLPALVHGSSSDDNGLQVARAVRDLRLERNLSQRQLAGRMGVPRTYISKIENGKATPTLSSLQRLADALEVDICNLVHDARSRRNDETAAVLSDPFLAEIAPYVGRLDALQRSMFLNQVRDMAMGRRKTA
jgi:transcriptional regulator with XRE-family HTH domain